MFYSIFGDFGSILLIILFIIAFVKISNLKTRISKLENDSRVKQNTTETLQIPLKQDVISDVAQNTEVVADNLNVPSTGDELVKWVKEDWLLKLGGLLLLIGLGWFTSYAFMHNWIGEVGRIMLGLLAGIVVLAIGTWRIKKYINQGGVFLVIGSTIILLTVFAAREMYNMFTPFIALLMMFLSAAYISLVSVKYDSLAVALSGLVLSGVAPLLTRGAGDDFALFSYLLAVVLGVIWIVAVKKKWGALVFASLVMVSLYSLPFVTDPKHFMSTDSYLLIFAYIFTAIFFVSSLVNILKSEHADIKSFLLVAIGNGIFILAWILAFVPKEVQSVVISFWMVLFAIGAFWIFRVTKIKECFYVYAGVAIAMLATATAVQLNGAALTVAYIIEGAIVPVLIYLTTKDFRVSAVSSLVLIAPVLFSIENIGQYSSSKFVFTKDFFVLFLMSVVLISVGMMFKKAKSPEDGDFKNVDNILIIGGSVYAYILLWIAIHIGIDNSSGATTVSLIIFTIIGLVKYFYGISVGSETLRNYGGIFLGLVVLRLLFVDVWEMDPGVRIVVFVLVGILLMSTAFIGKKIKSGFTNQ